MVRDWLGVYTADHYNIVDHFYQFGTIFGGAKSRGSLMHLVWFACVWVIWKERTDMIFYGKENYPVQFLEKIKSLTFWWFKDHSLIFIIAFIIGVKTHSYVRVFTNLCFLLLIYCCNF